MDSLDIQKVLLLKRVIYIVENNIGNFEERSHWIQKIVKETSELIILLPSLKEKVERFCENYNISTNTLNEQCSINNQYKKIKIDKLIVEHILQNDYSNIIPKYIIIPIEKANHRHQPHYFYHWLENVLIITILSHDFRNIPELEYKVESNYEIATHLDSDNENSYDSQPDLFNAVQRMRLYLCCSLFLQEKYLDVIQKIFYFNDKDSGFLHISQWNLQNNFIFEDEFYTIVLISALLTIPINKYKKFIQLANIQLLFHNFPLANMVFDLLVNINFKKFFNVWSQKVYPIVQKHFIIGPKLDEIEQKIRTKVYVFYLSVSDKIKISQLSELLGIKYNIVLNDLTKLFNERQSNFFIKGDIIFYKKRSIINDISSILKANENKILKLVDKKREDNHQLIEFLHNSTSTNSQNCAD